MKEKRDGNLPADEGKARVTFLDLPDWLRGETVERVFGCNYTIYPFPNIFSLGLAAILRREGFDVGHEDFGVQRKTRGDFMQWLRMDTSRVYCMHSVNLAREGDLHAVEIIRKVRGPVPVIFTGPGPTVAPRSYLRDPFTFVLRGEPDAAFARVARAAVDRDYGLLEEIPGISFLRDGNLVSTPSAPPLEDLDHLPFPARDLLDREAYMNPKLLHGPWTAMLTSRGCSFRCTYCVPHSQSFARELEYRPGNGNRKPPVRLRSLVNLHAELMELRAAGYRSFSIIDDQFMWGEKRTLAFCEMVRPTGLEWGCLARAHLVTEPVARALGKSGCRYVDIGAESFSQEILDFVHKDCSPEDTRQAVRLLKKHGVDAKLNILVGAGPLETRATLDRTLDEVLKLKPAAVMFSAVSPFPGTEFYEQAKREGWLVEDDYRAVFVQQKVQVKYPNLDQGELERWLRYATLRFYLSPGFVLSNVGKLVSWRAAKEGFKAWWRKLDFRRGKKVGTKVRAERVPTLAAVR